MAKQHGGTGAVQKYDVVLCARAVCICVVCTHAAECGLGCGVELLLFLLLLFFLLPGHGFLRISATWTSGLIVDPQRRRQTAYEIVQRGGDHVGMGCRFQ